MVTWPDILQDDVLGFCVGNRLEGEEWEQEREGCYSNNTLGQKGQWLVQGAGGGGGDRWLVLGEPQRLSCQHLLVG